ncbi:MAG TPA: hypothetical protein VK524_33710 [Polyangiaceae bacterium]|nr:hypothetical protein [Polyangiaceae bacterium]
MHQGPSNAASRLPRLMLAALGALALCALGAAPSQGCGSIPGGSGGAAGSGSGPIHVCGDGRISGMERCDGTNLGGRTCATSGVNEANGKVLGTLRCDPRTCTYDVRACSYPVCGNGIIEGQEGCDGTTLSPDATCGEGNPVNIVCDPHTCSQDNILSCKPATCGNGRLDGNERCDGTNLGTETCETLVGISNPTGLKCFANCQYDTRACRQRSGFCGNGIVERDQEQCDGDISCQQYAVQAGLPADYYLGGTVRCDSTFCTVKSANECVVNRSHCGNGILETQYGETCDGANLGGKTCQAAGFPFGTPRCSQSCQIDIYSGCFGGCINLSRAIYCQ